MACLQALVATYGGYFGAGLGIRMLALFSLLRSESIHALNALKSLLGAATNAVALAVFVAAGAVDWSKGLLMMGGALAGGYLAAAVAQRNPLAVGPPLHHRHRLGDDRVLLLEAPGLMKVGPAGGAPRTLGGSSASGRPSPRSPAAIRGVHEHHTRHPLIRGHGHEIERESRRVR